MKTVLELDFIDSADKVFKLKVDEPREDLSSVEVASAFGTILGSGVFTNQGKDLVAGGGARIITTRVEEIALG